MASSYRLTCLKTERANLLKYRVLWHDFMPISAYDPVFGWA